MSFGQELLLSLLGMLVLITLAIAFSKGGSQ